MYRNDQCWLLRLPFLLLLLLMMTMTIAGAVVGQEQTSRISDGVDQDVVGVRTFFDDIFGSGITEGQRGNAVRTGRTFGQKRIQFMMMPMIYKMGVMMTMLAVLTVISLKGLAIGVILLILKLGAILGKFYAFTSHQNHSPPVGWTPPQPVHVHLHNGGGYGAHGQAYSGWESTAGGGPPDDNYYYKG